MTTIETKGSVPDHPVGETWKLAKSQQLKRYYGRCSKHGERVVKWTSNGCCIDCNRPQMLRYRITHKTKILADRREWDHKNPEKAMLQRSRRRAKDLGLPFNLILANIRIPLVCPALGIPLNRAANSDASPSIDRVDNSKGYVAGNVIIVSQLANRIKNNATIEQLVKVANFYAKHSLGQDSIEIPSCTATG